MSTHSSGHFRSTSTPPKPPRRLFRSPSDTSDVRLEDAEEHPPPAPRQIYVLSADGSQLFLLDPTKPSGNEEPPPYAPFRVEPSASSSSSDIAAASTGAASPRSVLSPVPFPSIVLPQDTHSRHRASTVSAINQDGHRRTLSRPPVRNHNSFSHTTRARAHRSHSSHSSPGVPSSSMVDETTPLLGRDVDTEDWVEVDWLQRRKFWRAVFCGEIEEADEDMSWKAGWKRFWRPVGKRRYWNAMVHLGLINFPFALLIWPFLVAGTLAGTALLITLPIGAAIWWLTLFLTRSAARLEMIMQLHYHSPLRPAVSQPSYHPIFHRIKERASPPSAMSEVSHDTEIVWEKRFITCSYAMFCDHYSYSALSYFLLIKPLIVLFSTIALIALFPVCLVLVFTLPMYLRAARRWGQWQAGVAIDNL